MIIDDIDFAQMYRQHKAASTFQKKSAQEWDAKAKGMSMRAIKSPYVDDFVGKICFDGCKSALDVGCGPGTIALSLATKVERVRALDFSEGMLRCCEQNARMAGLDNIT